MHKVIVEVRINESAGRKANKHVPWTPMEIAREARACVDAGASVIHYHPRGLDGTPTKDYDIHRDIVNSLRGACDALLHPTLSGFSQEPDAEARLQPILRLVDEGLRPDLTPIIIATTNMTHRPGPGRITSDELVFQNTVGMTRRCVKLLEQVSIVPYADIWSIPPLLQITSDARAGAWPKPIYMMLGLMPEKQIIGHPATPEGLRAYLDFMPDDVPVQWSTYRTGGSLLDFIPQIIANRGHISIGLGDWPYPELGEPTNAHVVAEAVRCIRACGAEIATLQEARDMIGVAA